MMNVQDDVRSRREECKRSVGPYVVGLNSQKVIAKTCVRSDDRWRCEHVVKNQDDKVAHRKNGSC